MKSRIVTINEKIPVVTSDLNTLKENEVAVVSNGNTTNLFQLKEGKITNISSASSEEEWDGKTIVFEDKKGRKATYDVETKVLSIPKNEGSYNYCYFTGITKYGFPSNQIFRYVSVKGANGDPVQQGGTAETAEGLIASLLPYSYLAPLVWARGVGTTIITLGCVDDSYTSSAGYHEFYNIIYKGTVYEIASYIVNEE